MTSEYVIRTQVDSFHKMDDQEKLEFVRRLFTLISRFFYAVLVERAGPVIEDGSKEASNRLIDHDRYKD